MSRMLGNRWERRDLLRAAAGTSALMPAMLTARDTVQLVREAGLSVQELGARFDGRSDDAPALQRGIDEAARLQRPLVLPSGTARLGSPLDLKGRHIALLGDPVGRTVLQAAGPLSCLLDIEEAREVIDSPLYLYGLTLDGAGVATTGLRLRYRHRTVFDTLAIIGCKIGVEEQDSWLGRRTNCLTRATDTGWRLRGANHSSVWLGCTFTDARVAHLDIDIDGTAKDGNDALLFQGCDVEYGDGSGIVVRPGATATFETCYLGEGIGGDVLKNEGTVSIRGGVLFVGHRADRVGINALGGSVSVAEVSVRGQRFGSLDRLFGTSSQGELSGKVTFRDINMQLKVGGDPLLPGDALGGLPMRVFAPILGHSWQATASNAAMADASVQNERRVRCRQITGSDPVIGLAAPLKDTAEARRGDVAYLVIVYSATKPVELKFTNGPVSRAPWRLIGTLPATQGISTYVKADVPIEFVSYSAVELIMRAGVGDELTLHHATVSDASVLEPGPMANLAKAR
jgi:hypothetical protein